MAHILTSPFGSGPTARATFAKLSWVWWCTAMSPQYFGCLWKEFIYIPEWLQTFWILTLPILNYIIPLVGVSYHYYLIYISHFFRELMSKKNLFSAAGCDSPFLGWSQDITWPIGYLLWANYRRDLLSSRWEQHLLGRIWWRIHCLYIIGTHDHCFGGKL